MANAMLYYRTITTRAIDVGFSDPNSLPAAQKLQFNISDNILSDISRQRSNNIVQKPSPTNDGTRITKLIDNGADNTGDISIGPCYVRLSNDDATIKVWNWINLLQVDSYHLFGRFGILFPNNSKYSLDPDNTAGFAIRAMPSKNMPVDKSTEFNIDLAHGGLVKDVT